VQVLAVVAVAVQLLEPLLQVAAVEAELVYLGKVALVRAELLVLLALMAEEVLAAKMVL
jgi:hypothetical protein